MKLSTKGRYGTRLMFDLALHSGQGPVLLKDIAARQGVSEKYLWQLIPPLKNAGLLNSTRGSHGGYALAKPSSQITLKDIISVIEGPISLVQCTGDATYCDRVDQCVARDIWVEMAGRMSDIFKSVTLEDMVVQYKNRSELVTYAI